MRLLIGEHLVVAVADVQVLLTRRKRELGGTRGTGGGGAGGSRRGQCRDGLNRRQLDAIVLVRDGKDSNRVAELIDEVVEFGLLGSFGRNERAVSGAGPRGPGDVGKLCEGGTRDPECADDVGAEIGDEDEGAAGVEERLVRVRGLLAGGNRAGSRECVCPVLKMCYGARCGVGGVGRDAGETAALGQWV